MDERKKAIAGLEAEIQETRRSLDITLEEFGGILLRRIESPSFEEKKPFRNDAAEYGRLKREIEQAGEAIMAAGAEARNLRRTEEAVNEKENEASAAKEKLFALYRELGKRLLEDPRPGETVREGDPEGAPAPMVPGPVEVFRKRFDSLSGEIEDLEQRIEEQGAAGADNVFALIGKSAKTMLDRASLSRKRKALESLYEKTGAAWTPGADRAASETEKAAGVLRASVLNIEEDLAGLLEERRKLRESSGGEGGILRRIRLLENGVKKTEEEVRRFRRDFAERATERQKRRASLFTEKDAVLLEKIRTFRKTIRDAEKKAAELKASIAVD
ncbi:MAG: hypothetical protein LBD71_01010, partial [Treponema sp.]|nr:hypothetical protein [Treponema sp.]